MGGSEPTTPTTTAPTADDQNDLSAAKSDEETGERQCCASGCCAPLEPCAWKLAEYGTMHLEGKERHVSKGGSPHVTDETINTMTHFVALMLSLLGFAILVSAAAVQGKVWHIVSFSVYSVSLATLFLASTLHHGIHSTPEVEKCLLLFDYIAIFPLIAGTFTPFELILLRHDYSGWALFGVSWFIAISGMVLIATLREKFPRWISFTMYITLGWMGAFLALFSIQKIGLSGVAMVAAGGVLYTIGGAVFVVEAPNPYPGYFGFHEIWHLFVFLAAGVHWCVMYFWLLPYPYPSNSHMSQHTIWK